MSDKQATRTVVGPGGKDVFAVAICQIHNADVTLSSMLLEALSRDEARGIAQRMASGLKGKVMITVQSKLGPYDVETMQFVES